MGMAERVAGADDALQQQRVGGVPGDGGDGGLDGGMGRPLRRRRRLDASDQTRIDGIPITTVARTLFDLADVLPERQLERAFEEAERLRLFDLAAIEAVCARGRGRRARRRVLALLNALREPPATRSELERLFLDFCRAYGLPEPVFNVVIEGYEVDAWWPGTLIVVHDTRACAGVEIAWLRATWEGIITPLAEFIGDQKPLGIGVGRVN